MKNLETLFSEVCFNHKECYDYLYREAQTCLMFGDVENAAILSAVLNKLSIPKGTNCFDVIVAMLNQLNLLAFELESVCNDDNMEYWARHSYEIRIRSEKVSSEIVMNSNVPMPKFMASLAESRVNCGMVAVCLKRYDDAARYAKSALELPASESTYIDAYKIIEIIESTTK